MKQPILIAIAASLFFFSCEKGSVDAITKNINVSVIDSAFRVDSVSIVNLLIGTNDVTFDVKIHGNPLDGAEVEIWIGDVQWGLGLTDSQYIIEGLTANYPYLLKVNIYSKPDGNILVATREVQFITGNNVNNTNYLYDHRNYFAPMDHVATSDGGFVFLSWGTNRAWRNEVTEDLVFEYKYKTNLDFFKTDAQGKVVWRKEIQDVNNNDGYYRAAVIKTFDDGDLLVVAGCDIYRYSANGDRKWMYSLDNAAEANRLSDADIMDDGSVAIAGSTYNGVSVTGRIVLLNGDGTLISDTMYADNMLGVTVFFGITSTPDGTLFVIGRPADERDIGLIKLVNGAIVWSKRVIYDDYKDHWNTNMDIEWTPDNQLFLSAYLPSVLNPRGYGMVAKLDAEGRILNGNAFEGVELTGATMTSDGTVYLSGANTFGLFAGYNRMIVLNSDFSLREDLSFQGGNGASAAHNILAVPGGGVSIFGLCGGIQWHSRF